MATEQNSGGFTYDPVAGTPVDKDTANNVQSRFLEIKQDSTTAVATSGQALATLGAVKQEAVAARTAADQSASASAAAADTAERFGDDVELIKQMAEITPGSVTDAQTAILLQDPNTETHARAGAQTAAYVDPINATTLAGYVAVSEATSARVSDLYARAQPTPDGRTATSLITGQASQALTVSNSTRTTDTARVLNAAESARFTASAAVTASATLVADATPIQFGKASIVRALIWIDDPTLISSIGIAIRTQVTPAVVQWTRTNLDDGTVLRRGWNLLGWRASAGNTTAWGQAYRVSVNVVTHGATAWNVQSVWTEATPKAGILFIEDRGYKTFVDNGLPDLRARDIPVTWALDPALNGSNPGTKAEAITDAQVAQFYAEGDDVSIHAYAGEVTATMTAEQIRADTLKSHQWLQERGYVRGRQWRAAWTQNDAPEHAAAQPYYAAYATYEGRNSTESWPFTDPWNVKRLNLQGMNAATMDGHFATAQRTNCLLVCYTHGIHVDGGSDMTPAMWAHFITKIDEGLAGGWLEGVTFSQLLERSGGVLR